MASYDSYPGSLPAMLKYNHDEFVPRWTTPPTMEQMRAVVKESGKATFILTCLDPRCVPEQFFGTETRPAVARNAGGRSTSDVVRSIAFLRSLAHISTVAVVHHTDCGMTHVTQEQAVQEAKERTPDAGEEIEKIDFGSFAADDFEETIRKDVKTLRAAKVLGGLNILGFKLITETGAVEPVEV